MLPLLLTTFVLGLRHGIDWDHIAAITDITGSAPVPHDDARDLEEFVVRVGPSGEALAVRPRFTVARRSMLYLATFYALGHATMVAVLGTIALVAGALLPAWVDPILQRVVGVTLVLLGLWVVWSLVQFLRGKEEFRLRSRWMLVFSGAAYLWHRFHERVEGRAHEHQHRIASYSSATAYTVGLIHGFGAETGSQVLLIASVGGSRDPGQGILLMASFIVGLLASNSLIAVASASGFIGAQSRTWIYVVVGVLAGTFSLVVGGYFLLGLADRLPDLQQLLRFGG